MFPDAAGVSSRLVLIGVVVWLVAGVLGLFGVIAWSFAFVLTLVGFAPVMLYRAFMLDDAD